MFYRSYRYLFIFILIVFSGLFYFSSPVFAAGESWLTGWSYRRTITIDHDKVGGGTENELNFPILVSLTGLSNINANGTDIRFTSSDGATQLPREIESYSGGTLVAWVKIPTVSYTANTVIYMYYGNSSATEPTASSDYGSQKVWTENFNGVWHMGSSLTADSTTNENTGTNTGVTASTGKVGGGGYFDGSSYISVPDDTTLNPSQFSVEFWMNTNTVKASSWNSFFSKEHWDGDKGWFFYRGAEDSYPNEFGFVRSQHDVPKDTGATITNGWHYVVGTFNGSTTMELFIDGSSKSSKTNITGLDPLTASSVPLYFGARHGNDGTGAKDFAIGDMDEIRFSSSVRSAGWVTTVYNNQSAPSTFLTAGSEEDEPVATPTPTPISTTSTNNSSSNNNVSASSCNTSKPVGAPDLFQIDVTKESATVYFTPVSGIFTYYVSYATKSSAEEHGVEVHLGSNGVQKYTMNNLASDTLYYFKVRGQNGCMPGDWSSIKSAKTFSNVTGVSETVEDSLSPSGETGEEENPVSLTPTPTIFISSIPSESPSVKGTTTTMPSSSKPFSFHWNIPKIVLPAIAMPHLPTFSFVPWQQAVKEKIQTMKLTALAMQQVVVEKNKSLGEKIKLSSSTLASIWLDTNPTRIVDVKVKEHGTDYAVISWETNHPATSKVSWGDSYDYGKSTESMNLVTHHEVNIAGLTQGKTYYYEVMSEGKNYVFDARHEFIFR